MVRERMFLYVCECVKVCECGSPHLMLSFFNDGARFAWQQMEEMCVGFIKAMYYLLWRL